MKYLAVGLGGIAGALTRYGAGLMINDWWKADFPLGTMLINLSGSFIMAGVLRSRLAQKYFGKNLSLALTTGFLGSYTTFSTFSLETIRLINKGKVGSTFVYVIVSLLGGILGAWAASKGARVIDKIDYLDGSKGSGVI